MMHQRKDPQPRLSLISDEYGRAGRLGRLHVVAAPPQSPPFSVVAVAEEQDTHLLLSAESEVSDPGESLSMLIKEVQATPPNTPGNVLVRKAKPLRLLAIVHDVDGQPTWREEWIASALCAIVEEVEWRRLESVGIPLIGTRHGGIDPVRVATWLGRCLAGSKLRYLKRVWLIAPMGSEAELMQALRSQFSP
jgi:hypothetical protein